MMKKASKILSVVGGVAVLVLLILYMGGFFRTGVIKPGVVLTAERSKEAPPLSTAQASTEKIPLWYEAVGTVRSHTTATISARVSGKILSVLVKSGSMVKEGDPLIHLDDRESQARLDQASHGFKEAEANREHAEQSLAGAQSVFKEAESNYRRVKTYLEQEAATKQDMERAEAAFLQARAGMEQAKKRVSAAAARVEQAKKVMEEVRVGLGHAAIDAPQSGQIAKRLVDPGDMAWPGKPLLVLQAPGSLRLEADVREGLISKISPGMRLPVTIDAIDLKIEGGVEEIVPSAEAASRTFLVKVSIPATSGLYPGMFGRLRVPLGEREAVLVPKASVRRIGQMEIVRVEEEGRWIDLFVKTGREINGKVEILSGLNGSERIALEPNKKG
jgi:HlyD family secretion protein